MKEKLTLSVDKRVVKKAKEMGINISEITESVLKGFTFEPTSAEKTVLVEKYNELFKAMLPSLKKLNTTTKVGTAVDMLPTKDGKGRASPALIGDIYLTPEGILWIDDAGLEIELDKISGFLDDLNEPKEILSNFIDSLSKAAERQKKKLKELEMAKKIVDAISSAVTNRPRVTN